MQGEQLLPVQAKERIQALDFLRGFAILGILMVNIQSFSMPEAAYLNPTAYGDLLGINKWIWILTHVFFDSKFMTLFSILYGAGVVLVTQKAELRTGHSAGIHYKRTFWLLLIGLFHAHLIWYGDILVPYALCALFVYFFRNLKPKRLLIVGLIFVSIHTFIYLFFGWSIPHWSSQDLAEAQAGWLPSTGELNSEIAALTGSISEQIAHNSQAALMLETFVFLILFLWRAGGLMLVGMALYKWGVLTAKREIGFYKRGLIMGWLLGFPLVIYGVYANFSTGWTYEYSMFLGGQFNYWGSLGVSFGYICLIMIIAKSQLVPWLRDRLAAIGQMALTNYIGQSVICILIFYGIGFGLFGQFERWAQFIVVIAIWILQLIWSRPWLNHFRYGPLEWMWRSLTYWKVQIFRK